MQFRTIFLITTAFVIFYTLLCVSRVVSSHQLLGVLTSIAATSFILWMQLFRRRAYKETYYEWILAWGSSFGLGVWSSFVIYCVLVDGINLLLVIAQLLGMDSLAGFDRIYWVSTGIKLAFIASLVTSFIGLLQAGKGPIVRRITVPVDSLPEELIGLRIVQISDLHIGVIIKKNYIEKVVDKVLALAPDIIAITGDLGDGKPQELHLYTQPLAALIAPLGTYYVTGNHEYYFGAVSWIAEAQRLGLTPLINENRVLDYRQRKIMVAGVTDITAHHFIPDHYSDPHTAVASDLKCDVRILLAHQPESYVEAQAAGFDIQLSGHTHAGQYFPFSLLIRLGKRYARGLHFHKTLWIYVNSGTGFWGAANRFGIPAEITLIELAKGL